MADQALAARLPSLEGLAHSNWNQPHWQCVAETLLVGFDLSNVSGRTSNDHFLTTLKITHQDQESCSLWILKLNDNIELLGDEELLFRKSLILAYPWIFALPVVCLLSARFPLLVTVLPLVQMAVTAFCCVQPRTFHPLVQTLVHCSPLAALPREKPSRAIKPSDFSIYIYIYI